MSQITEMKKIISFPDANSETIDRLREQINSLQDGESFITNTIPQIIDIDNAHVFNKAETRTWIHENLKRHKFKWLY